MKILIYKRTHKGDPDENGIFGNQDCMGRVRNWNYDAVIGIGGKTTWSGDEGIKHKINWIGLNPKKFKSTGKRGDCVVFSHFELYEDKGQDIENNYPMLFDYMYGSRKRFDMASELPESVLKEVQKILKSVEDSPQSKEYDIDTTNNRPSEKSNHLAKCKGSVNGKDVEVSIEIDEVC